MAWSTLTSQGPRRARQAGDRGHERGATFTEYALVTSVVLVGALGALTMLEDESGSYLEDTGSDIAVPRELAADLDVDLPDPPDWLAAPPPPP
ncbi:MAG: Flp family type IVb pilin, partial [Acidimicrobiales bacterium]